MTEKQMEMAREIQDKIDSIEQDIRYLRAYSGCFGCRYGERTWRLSSFTKEEEAALKTKMLKTMNGKVADLKKQFNEL